MAVLRLENISGIGAFVQAADLRSFKQAGQRVGLTSSAVGKAITRLEEQLGTRLFHRSTRSISLTQEGALFLERCRRILSEVEAAESELAHASARPRGLLRVSLPLAGSLLTPLFGLFLDRHPEVELDLDYNDRFVDVIDDGYDAVIRTGEPSDSRLMHRHLGNFTWRLAAAPAYLEKRGIPETVTELAKHACLRHRFPQTGKLAEWGVSLPEGATLPVTLCASANEPLIQLAAAGHGIAQLPYFTIRDELARKKLIEILPGSVARKGGLSLLWPASRFPLPKVRAFVAFIGERVANAMQEDGS